MFRVLLGIAAAGFCAAQTIQEFPTSNFAPYGIAAGSDGALWFTPSSVSPVRTALGRMTTAGAFTQHALPAGFSASNSPIVAAPDGNLWFQISNGSMNAIARMTTAGTVTQFAANSFVAPVHSMTVGPDGAIWMTESTTRIGRITTSGSYSFHSVGGFNPFGIVAGSDGNLWFTAVPPPAAATSATIKAWLRRKPCGHPRPILRQPDHLWAGWLALVHDRPRVFGERRANHNCRQLW